MFTVVQAAPSMQHRIPPPLFEKGGVQNLCGLSFVDPLTLFNSRNIHHIVHICQGLCEHGSLFKGGRGSLKCLWLFESYTGCIVIKRSL